MLTFWAASGQQTFSMEEALQWCTKHHPEIASKRFGALIRAASANRKRDRQPIGADLLWQLTPNRFMQYNPATDPPRGSKDAAAWVIRLALQERDDVASAEALRRYCEVLAAAVDALTNQDETLQKKADSLADLVRAEKLELFLSYVSELSAAFYFQRAYPAGFHNHVSPHGTGGDPAKNFDFSFQTDGVRFNVEVKATSKPFDQNSKGGIKYFLPESVKQGLYDAGAEITPNLAPTVGRFLMEANDQLFRRDDDLNVALICCNDPDEYADIIESLFGRFGIFNMSRVAGVCQTLPNSIIKNIALLENIDAVVVCLSGFLHAGIVNTQRFSKAYRTEGCSLADPSFPWDIRKAFPSVFWLHTPPAEANRELALQKAFNSVTGILLDYYNQCRNWQKSVFALINRTMP
jgi:hypothetical protein